MEKINNKLIASDGMTLTDGEAFGKMVYLASGADVSDWREVTDEEAAYLKKALEEAQAEDYENALSEMGVEL